MLSLLIGMVVLAGCGQATVTPDVPTPASMPKVLATVFISPTPNSAEAQATLGAITPTPTIPAATASSQPTAYVGVFLGEVEPEEGGMLFGSTTQVALDGLPTLDAPAAACSIPIDEVFGTTWLDDPSVRERIGCPIENAVLSVGTLQIFERGVMYWRSTGEIWAISPGNRRYWYVASAPPVPPGEISAPEGLRAPVLGFGAVWRGVEGVRDTLGFATTDEEQAEITLQRFQGGAVLADRSSGQVFVLFADSTAAGPY